MTATVDDTNVLSIVSALAASPSPTRWEGKPWF
jgi:hypothetical protein